MVKKAVRILAGIYLCWIALSVLIILPAINFLPPWYVKQEYNRTLSSDITLFNPFTLSVEMRNAALLQPDGAPFAALDQALVNLSTRSLVTSGVVLDEIALRGLELELRQVAPGVFNFSDLLPSDTEAAEPAGDSGELFGLTVHELTLTADIITLADDAREEPFSTHYDGLAINVKDLSTISEDGKPYRINLTAEEGGALQWEGTVSVPLSRSEGWLAIDAFNLVPVWRFARPWLNYDLIEGRLGVEGNYEVSWADEVSYAITEARAEVVALDIRPSDTAALPDTGVRMQRLDVTGIAVDSLSTRVEVAAIAADGLQVDGWSEGEQISLADMFATDFPADENPAPAPQSEPSPWQVSIARMDLGGSGSRWRSEFTDPPTMSVTPLNMSLENFSWPLAGTAPASLELTVNDTASLQLNGEIELGQGDASVGFKLDALPLPWFNPNLPAALKATITGGEVGMEGKIDLVDFAPTTLNMDTSIENFSGRIEGEEEALTRWDKVRLKGLAVDLPGRSASLQQLFIHDYAGRIHIAEDGSVNASRVWQEEVGEQAEEIAQELELDKPWAFSVPEILISASAIDFMDESLPIPFRTIIGDVNGQVLNISSVEGAETSVDIRGSVDGYAPVALVGSAVPFNSPPDLDLLLSFDGVDLVLLTPYSGTYAGYAIERGLLHLELKYALQDGRLKGDNQVLIDQLKLGEKVDSDKAVDLPLELALALLTDANGVIDLQVPVEGDIDDPEFAIGGVVVKAFMNLITKAVTAPFSLLANLVGSEEDLQRLGFGPGSAELSEAGQTKLDQLAEALRQRPGLTLVVEGAVNPEPDTERLQRALLVQDLVAAGFTELAIERREPAVIDAIKERYVTLFGEPPEGMSLTDQYSRVLTSYTLDPGALRALATARAAATKDYLVNQQGLPANRAVVEVPEKLGDEHSFSGVLMDLDD